MIDEAVSHYHILGKLGEGGRGFVYEAEDPRFKRLMKKLHLESGGGMPPGSQEV